VKPIDLSKGPLLLGNGCTASAAPGGTLKLDCHVILTGRLETPEVTADLELHGDFATEGSVAGGRLVDATLVPKPAVVRLPKPVPVVKPDAEEEEEEEEEEGADAGDSEAAGDSEGMEGMDGSSSSDTEGMSDAEPITSGGNSTGSDSTSNKTATAAAAVVTATAGTAAAAAAATTTPKVKSTGSKSGKLASAGAVPGARCKSGSSSSCKCEDGWAADSCIRVSGVFGCLVPKGITAIKCPHVSLIPTHSTYPPMNLCHIHPHSVPLQTSVELSLGSS